MGIRRELLAASLIALVVPSYGLAAPGELDAAFGLNGLATFRFGYGKAAVQQPDGKLLIAASSWSHDFAVLRLNTDGSLDSTFASNGIATIDFSGNDECADLLLLPDGKIIVAGTAGSETVHSRFAIARLNPDGTLDTTFDGDGRVLIDTSESSEWLSSVVSTPDGRVVATGYRWGAGNYDMVFIRLLGDGALDPTFGTGSSTGTMLVDSGINDQPSRLLLLPDGKYLACGRAEIPELVYVGTMLAVRLNPNGSLDRAFGTDGFARLETDARGYPSAAEACLSLADGTIVLAGWELREAGVPAPILVRLRPDGARDTATWDDGLLVPEIGPRSTALAIIAVEGDLVISGDRNSHTLWGATVRDGYVARIDGASGALDEDFGDHGVTTMDFSYGTAWATDHQNAALLRQADGKLVIVGGAWFIEAGFDGWPEIAAARVDPNGGGHPGIAGFAEPFAFVNGNAAISVRRTGGGTGPLLVDFETVSRSAVAPRDYTDTRGTLTWVDGDMAPKIVKVSITPAAANERENRFDVLLSTSSSSLALDESWVYIADPSPPSAGGSSGSGSSGATGTVPMSGAGDGGGGATGLETLLILGGATLLTIRRRLAVACAANRVRQASGVA